MANTSKSSARTVLIHTLIDLLHKKSFPKISVNELCETANISRSAFYANFEDKYHLFSCCLEEQTNNLNALMEEHSAEEFLFVTLDFIQKEKRFFYNIFGADLDEEVAEKLYQFFEKHLTEALKEKSRQGLVLPGSLDIVTSFYIGGLTTSTFRWLKGGCKLSKEEVVASQYYLLKDIF